MYDSRRHLFGARRWTFRRSYEDLWPFADAWSATVTVASLNEDGDARSVLESFSRGLVAYHRSPTTVGATSEPLGFESVVVPPLGTGGDVFFDDNTWLGLALVHEFSLSRDERTLSTAQRLFEFVVSGWSSNSTWSHPGGIRWKQPVSNVSRNTCSNAPVAQLACRIHAHTKDDETLAWATRIYDWVRATLRSSDDLYFDQIAPDGRIIQDLWTYNQGTMIGAGVLLGRITGDRDYLAEAASTASASLAHFELGALVGQGPAFNAVYFRNLLLLDQEIPNPRYRQLAAEYADEMWVHHRDGRTGLFGSRGAMLNPSSGMVEIFALLGGAAPHA